MNPNVIFTLEYDRTIHTQFLFLVPIIGIDILVIKTIQYKYLHNKCDLMKTTFRTIDFPENI